MMIYREVQPAYRAKLIWIILIPTNIFLIIFIFLANAFSPLSLIIIGVLPIIILCSRLITEVREDGIYVKFSPLHIRYHKQAFADIESYECTTYSPMADYGGWGIKYGSKGKAYNMSGNEGLLLHFTNGKRLLIGSQKPEALMKSMEQTRFFRSRRKESTN